MKKYLLLSLFLINALYLLAQNTSLVVFSQSGEPFKLVLNGILYNDEAQTNVTVKGLNPTTYQATLIFENSEIGDLSGYVNLRERKEMTYAVKRRKVSVEEKLALMTLQNIARDFNLKDEDEVEAKKAEIERKDEIYSLKLFTEVAIKKQHQKASAKVKEINNNVTVNEVTSVHEMEKVQVEDVAVVAQDSEVIEEVTNDEYVEERGCEMYMDQPNFEMQITEISRVKFEDQKLSAAQELVNNNCLKVNQIEEILDLFTFDNSRLEIAKLAYSNTYDQLNFEKLYDLFSFESSKVELKEFVIANK
ncbi:MAG: DUF4476 domain-containing protein [Bacteroidetes bacterium]|nr:DUF4476 domain-containing protein [Bacteroidota bacterium]MBT5528863.1 DUF4476 domain-containing protein [Cytophagia bacterium]MBT5989549.1 DUF4476 domain-containing protein [Bacteroidota bacterium]